MQKKETKERAGSSLIKDLTITKVFMKWEEASILNLARKDSENNIALGRFCPILSLLPKLIWSCLKPPQKASATECFRATHVTFVLC